MKQSEEHFVKQVRDTLDQSVSDLDSTVQVRLQAARLSALEAGDRKHGIFSFFSRGIFPVAGALAAAMVVFVVFWLQRPEIKPHPQEYVLDAEILESQDNLEMLLDIDFYVWLAEEQVNGAG